MQNDSYLYAPPIISPSNRFNALNRFFQSISKGKDEYSPKRCFEKFTGISGIITKFIDFYAELFLGGQVNGFDVFVMLRVHNF